MVLCDRCLDRALDCLRLEGRRGVYHEHHLCEKCFQGALDAVQAYVGADKRGLTQDEARQVHAFVKGLLAEKTA